MVPLHYNINIFTLIFFTRGFYPSDVEKDDEADGNLNDGEADGIEIDQTVEADGNLCDCGDLSWKLMVKLQVQLMATFIDGEVVGVADGNLY